MQEAITNVDLLMKCSQVSEIKVRKPYATPALRIFGKLHLLTQKSGGSQDGGAAMMDLGTSDRSVKENIVRVGDHPLGIGLYLFDYIPGHLNNSFPGRQFGVMADEVETVLPEAVSVHPDGYKMVNYSMLNLCRTIN